MAARKSCTHLTWAEAKSKSGMSSSTSSSSGGGGYKKNKEMLRKIDHGKVLAQKVIAKNTATNAAGSTGGNSNGDRRAARPIVLLNDRKIKKAYKKQEIKMAAISAQRHEEREQRRLDAMQEVRLYDRINDRAIQIMMDKKRRKEVEEEEEEEGCCDCTDDGDDDDGQFPSPPILPQDDVMKATVLLPSSHQHSNVDDDDDYDNTEEAVQRFIRCRQLQVEEVSALESMFPEQDDFVISKSCRLDDLKDKLERIVDGDDNDDDDDSLRRSIANHPPITFWIKLEIENPQPDSVLVTGTSRGGETTNNNDDDDEEEDNVGDEDNDDGDDDDAAVMDLVATIVLRVTLPPLYLLDDDGGDGQDDIEGRVTPSMPQWTFEYVMVSDRNYYCSADKALESLAWLDEIGLKQAMAKEAHDVLLPYPCVYELCVVWLSEHIFEYLQLHTQHYALRR